MNDVEERMLGKTVKEAEVDGFGIRMVFTDGAVFDYDASDGGCSQYELTEATADTQAERKKEEINRIESAIRHIQTSTDIDPWAMEIAVDAMRKQMPQKAMKSIDAYDKNLYKLYRVGFMNKVSKGYARCAACGQMIDWEEGDG